MGGGKKKKDPAKELAKKQRKAAKAEKCANKREGKEDRALLGEEVDLVALIAEQRAKDASRTEVTISKLEPVSGATFAPFPHRCNASLSAAGDDLYLFGGEQNEGDQTTVFNDLYKYKTGKGEWYRVESINAPSPRCSHQAVALGKHVYVFGGEYATLTQFYHYKDLWRLDTKTLAWEEVQPVGKKGPSARSGHRCCEWRGKLLLFGGFFKANSDVSSVFMNDCWLYSPSDNEWRELEFSKSPGVPKPPIRSGCVLAASQDASAYVWGGYSEVRCDNAMKAKGKEHADCWKLTIHDPFSSSAPSSGVSAWDRYPVKGHVPDSRCGAASCARLDSVYVFGGVHDVDGDGLTSTSLFYDDLHVMDVAKKRWKYRDVADKDDDGSSSAAAAGDDDEPKATSRAWDAATLAATLRVAPPPLPRHKAKDVAPPPPPPKKFKGPPAPPPRIGAAVAFHNKLLYVAGGALEVGDKELALDDFWAVDTRKKTATWTRLLEGTMTQRSAKWKPDDEDDDDDDEDDDDDDDDDDSEDLGDTSSDSDDETIMSKRSARRTMDEDESKEESKADGLAPRPDESKKEFFERTKQKWLQTAAERGADPSDAKSLKKIAFSLASELFDDAAPRAAAPTDAVGRARRRGG